MAATNSFLRMPDVPLTPTWLASARSSGSSMVDRVPTGALVLTSGVSVVTAFDGGLLSVLSPAVNKSVSVTDCLSSPLIRSYGGSLHSAKLPSAPNHRLCNGDRQDRRMERRTSFTRRIGVVLAARQYGCRCGCCDCWTAPRITCILAGSKQTLPPRCGL